MQNTIKALVFNVDKHTDKSVRISAPKGQILFGSMYVHEEDWPKNATGIKFVPEFTYEVVSNGA